MNTIGGDRKMMNAGSTFLTDDDSIKLRSVEGVTEVMLARSTKEKAVER